MPADPKLAPLKIPSTLHVVSFPRSGQHLLANIIRDVAAHFDLHMSYRERYQAGNICTDDEWWRKHHDFKLDFQPESDGRWVVLLRRDKDRRLEALWRWRCTAMRQCESLSPLAAYEHRSNVEYYEGFRRKWAAGSDSVVFWFHGDFLSHPVETVTTVLSLAYPETVFDSERVATIIESHNVTSLNAARLPAGSPFSPLGA